MTLVTAHPKIHHEAGLRLAPREARYTQFRRALVETMAGPGDRSPSRRSWREIRRRPRAVRTETWRS